MTTRAYRIDWDNGHACGTLSGTYDTEAEATRAARAWKRDMVAAETTPQGRREAGRVYQWEVVAQMA